MPETDATSTDFPSTPLARAAEVPVPEADVLAGRFPLTANPSPVAEDERAAVLAGLHFGDFFTDHMAHARWRQGEGWGDYGVVPYGSLSLSPAAAVLHYGQEIFEGIKAYRHKDGSVWTFRPRYNAARLLVADARIKVLQTEAKGLPARDPFELLHVYELKERLTVCRALIAHLAARKETRWHIFGENADYPARDAAWDCYVNTRLVDGRFEVITRPLVKGDRYEH